MERIKVLQIIPTLDQSGAEKQFALLATHLPQDEFDVQCVALTRGGFYSAEIERAGLPLTILNKRTRFDPFCLMRLGRLVEQFKPDVVHSWLFAGNAYSRLAIGRKRPPAVVVSERCVDSWKAGWQKWLDRRQIGSTDILLANSQSVADFYAQLGVPSDKIRMIRNAVEVPEARSGHSRLRDELGLPQETRLVGYVGRLARQKRIRDVIWGMQLLQQITDNVHFVIAGDGPENEAIDDLMEQFDVVRLMHRLGHREDAAEIIRELDVLWLASEFEGQSNSVMEALAAGTPVVCSGIDANRELIEDGENGFVVSVGDSVGFAQFTDRILADPELSKRLARNGQDRMRADFSLDQMVQSHAELYRELAHSVTA